MTQQTDLLYAVLALQMNFISKDQLVECGALWASDRSRSLPSIMDEKGYLVPEAKAALEGMVKAQIKVQGDPEKSLAAMPVDEDMRRSLLALPLDDKVRGTLMEHRPGRGEPRVRPYGADAVETIVVSKPREESRYRLGAEIGKGGLGRVVAAEDTVLGRQVAVKEMLAGAKSPDLIKRFLREGEVAGKLLHPNIVPVFDVGVREETADVGGAAEGHGDPRRRPHETRKVPYFAMGRIVGRDLKEIIKAVENGEEKARHDFSRPRLLRVFQDVCLAMACAHDHGVIHRDLKPANVMVGKNGEVYVVDWGLAKTIGEKEDALATMAKGDSKAPALTMDGDTLGTPAYMPPEQADGKIEEIDHQSDIYSLGAILYELLTFRPPFEGTTGLNVIAKVLTGELTPPSARASEIRKAMQGTRKDEEITFPESVPPELEEIVLKAMAKDKALRYGSVTELNEEVQRFLEGEKERERNRERALAKVAAGKILVEKMEKLRAEVKEAEKEAEEAGKEIKPHWPVEKKEGFWAAQDRVKKLRREIVETFTETGNTFQEALGFERRNPEARAALADLYWDQYLREEEGGDESEMIHYEGLVRQYNDGQYDARLKGDGTLTISTRNYSCRCLAEGRMVTPEELEGGRNGSPGGSPSKSTHVEGEGPHEQDQVDQSAPEGHQVDQGIMGYHPFSGRALDGHKGGEGLPELEPKEPLHLKVHGPECTTEALDGADVWLFQYEEHKKILLPVFPEGVEAEGTAREWVPDAVLDRCFDEGSPYRPKEGFRLGKTPVAKFTLPMGSYLLILHKEGFHPVRCPVYIGRLADEEVDVTLYRDGEIPEGFVQVPAGKFIFGGDKENPYSGPKEIKETDDCFIAKFPVTCREYVEFLNDLATRDPEEAERRAPRKTPTTGVYWPKDTENRYHIPTEKWLSEASEDLKEAASKLESSPIWWDEDWPIFSVSWEDLTAFAAWRSAREESAYCLTHDLQWEKAARGMDGRFFPYGNFDDASFFNQTNSHEGGMRPCPVDSFPVDESPYGVRGLAGNSRDLCLNDVGEEKWIGWRLSRGGGWPYAGFHGRSASRTVRQASYVYYCMGVRLSWLSRCRTP